MRRQWWVALAFIAPPAAVAILVAAGNDWAGWAVYAVWLLLGVALVVRLVRRRRSGLADALAPVGGAGETYQGIMLGRPQIDPERLGPEDDVVPTVFVDLPERDPGDLTAR
ncbi:hypothetical protein AFE02nite_28460 [Actinotalea fermentans]|uniref:Uncharacterized protein n=2 Tax=Actinotalea fermentans TaxID=43671 RepID=A0A511Z102_9CELL|nr:hypothetical protein AFE02nite_28460 [Actinotalea fermentans]